MSCIVSLLSLQFRVLFVDYGDQSVISLSDLRLLQADFRYMPRLALNMKLNCMYSVIL